MGKGSGSLPVSGSIDELVEYFETHDMGDDLENLPEVQFDIDLGRRTHLVAVAEDLVGKIGEMARSRHISSESLINSILREKIAEAG